MLITTIAGIVRKVTKRSEFRCNASHCEKREGCVETVSEMGQSGHSLTHDIPAAKKKASALSPPPRRRRRRHRRRCRLAAGWAGPRGRVGVRSRGAAGGPILA